MELRQCFTVLMVLAGSSTPLTSLAARCPTRKYDFKIAREMLVQQEKAQQGGHQPWRSDARMVAQAGISQVDKKLSSSELASLGCRVLEKSEMKAVFLFEPANRKMTYRVTVNRFRIRMPDSQRLTNTVWWSTEVIVTNCSRQTTSRARPVR
jgi:hypothetical protein